MSILRDESDLISYAIASAVAVLIEVRRVMDTDEIMSVSHRGFLFYRSLKARVEP